MSRILVCIFFHALISASTSFAGFIALDDASNATYDGGWVGNGGFGFTDWNFSRELNAGQFVASSTNNGDGDSNGSGDIDTSGRSWGLFSGDGRLSEATRGFAFGNLAVGSSFNISMDNGFINGPLDGGADGTFGIALQSAGANRIEFFFQGGTTHYQINDSTGASATSLGFSDEGMDLSLLLTSADTYSLTITPDSGIATTLTGTLAGTAGSGIDGLRVFSVSNQRFDNDMAADGFINSLSVNDNMMVAAVPEPSSFLMMFAGIGWLVYRRRSNHAKKQLAI